MRKSLHFSRENSHLLDRTKTHACRNTVLSFSMNFTISQRNENISCEEIWTVGIQANWGGNVMKVLIENFSRSSILPSKRHNWVQSELLSLLGKLNGPDDDANQHNQVEEEKKIYQHRTDDSSAEGQNWILTDIFLQSFHFHFENTPTCRRTFFLFNLSIKSRIYASCACPKWLDLEQISGFSVFDIREHSDICWSVI